MIHTVAAGIFYGAGLGAVLGWASRLALKKTLGSSSAVFFSVFVSGLLARLAALIAAVCLLRHKIYIIIIAFAAAMILVQMAFELVPLDKNGTKRNS